MSDEALRQKGIDLVTTYAESLGPQSGSYVINLHHDPDRIYLKINHEWSSISKHQLAYYVSKLGDLL